jgi:nucleoside-diphosphate-sugar epimerase
MKEEAEELLLKRNEFRKVIIRPGFMYGTDRWATVPMSLGVTFTSLFTAGMMPKALCVDTVARALLTELDNPERESLTMEIPDISRVGSL